MNKIRIMIAAVAAMAAVLMCAPSVQAADKHTVTVKGSDTLVNLSATWAEAFMNVNPDIQVSVTGGGSGVGLAALLNGTTDIANASRDVKPAEKKKGLESGIEVVETNVALDGIAIIVNQDNPLTEITLDQLKQIYTGEVNNWQSINGVDLKIMPISRETSSGTYVFFQEHVLKMKDYTPSALLMPATSAIVEAVANDKPAIGYVGLGYAAQAKDRVKVLPVKADEGSPAIEANIETVQAGQYPIARPLHCYTNGAPAGAIKAFMDFCLSPDGQKMVQDQGFVPLN